MRTKTFSATAIIALALAAAVGLASAVRAYDQYSENRDATNCRACHGDFRANDYMSSHDGQPWSVTFAGQTYTSLHQVHRQFMVSGDCNTCHFPSRFPVDLRSSTGGTGFQPISCAGCHGRAEDETGTSGYAAGLRQHHFRNGVSVCVDCHDDANPTNYTPVAEDTAPPYYFTPDASHPNKPTDPCNPGGVGENVTAGPDALDNDGDDLYDSLDCGGLFIDGFETGDTSRWSNVIP